MPRDFIEKMARYVAFLHREIDVWNIETNWPEKADLFNLKIEACSDICSMLNCRSEVWREAKKIYDWESGDVT